MARNALGKGLGALIRDSEGLAEAARPPAARPTGGQGQQGQARSPGAGAPLPGPAFAAAIGAALASTGAGGVLNIDIDLIDPSPYQPRTRFAEEALEELAQSIRASGIIQPLVARRAGSRYQLVAGERRWRAAQRAQFHRVPVIVRDVSDEQALELTLVENIQREDLNPVEQARAFQRLMDQFHLTQDEVAARTGKDRATVANAVRLLMLPESFLEWIEMGKLTAGHGRALLAIEDPQLRLSLAQKACRGRMTVRQLERMATRRARGRAQAVVSPTQDPNRLAAISELERHLGTRVWLHMPEGKRPGQLILDFYDEEQLNALYDRLMG